VGSYTLNNGTLAVQYEYAGWYGDGTFNQNAGTHTATGLYVGYGLNAPADGGAATGAFHLAGASFASSSFEQIGIDCIGAFHQTGGTHTVGQYGSNNGSLTHGLNVTGVGAYDLASGTLTVNGNETVGGAGSGTFTQTGGTHAVTGTLTVAAAPGSAGTFHLTGGSLTAPVVNNGQFDLGRATYTGSFTNNATLNVTAPGSAYNGALTANAPALTYVNFPLTVPGGVTNAGSLVIANATPLTADGPGLNNDGGNISLLGGSLAGTGPVTSTGTISGFGAISGGGTLTNNGTITQTAGNLTFAKAGGTTNNNQITLAAGRQLVLISP
jgi:hypothetical protein